ncbi:MAG: hypothetical protein LBH55_03410 [Mycoplasmataceae bacterium]|nr:hypothetical protein [Mycoplasmataceae bacterium]
MSKHSEAWINKKLKIENEKLIKSSKRLQKTINEFQDVIKIQKELINEYVPKIQKEKILEGKQKCKFFKK